MIANTSQGKNSIVRWKMIREQLPHLDGYSLVDIGCEEGFFCQKFLEAGGGSAYGVEIDEGKISLCTCLMLENFTVAEMLPEKQFDICFYLSLHFHEGIDYLQWCKDHSKMLFVETSGNPDDTKILNVKLKEQLVKLYENVKELGITEYAGRMLYLCY